MSRLSDIDLNDPDYVNANTATKQAIFDAYSKDDPDYTGANTATQNAIRESFGVTTTTPPAAQPSIAPNIASAVGEAAVGKLSPINPYGATLGEAGQALKTGAGAVANKIGQTTVSGAGALAADAYAALHGLPPIATIGKKVLQSVMPGSQTTIAEGLGALGQGAKGMVGGAMTVGKNLAQGFVDPANLFTLPYQMAAYEQERIRQNPNGPLVNNTLFTDTPHVVDTLKTNPYAQTVRGEAATQGQAGAMNARNAVANMPFGNVTAQERARLEQDQRDRQQRQAQQAQARAILAQPPTAQNFIARSKATADLYGGVGK